MTTISRQLLQKAGLLPKLRLGLRLPKGGVKPTGPHRVKVLEDKIHKKPDQTGKEVEYVRYILEEDGEKKYYDTKLRDKSGGLSYLVQRFAEIAEGEEVILEIKKQGIKNYVEVTPTSQSALAEVEDEDEHDEPVVNYEEPPM